MPQPLYTEHDYHIHPHRFGLQVHYHSDSHCASSKDILQHPECHSMEHSGNAIYHCVHCKPDCDQEGMLQCYNFVRLHLTFIQTIINAWTSVDCRTTYSHTTQVTLPAATISTPAAFRPATSAMYATTKALSKLNRRAVATPARKDVNVATVTCTMLTVMVAPASTSMQPDVTQTSTRTVYQTPPRLTIISSNVETRTVPTTAYFESCTAKGVFQTTITLATVTPSPSVFACGANNLLDGVARVTSNPGKASSYILGPVVGLTYADGVNKINSQGPTNAADCCKACWTDSTCLGSAWLQPEGRCGVFRTSSGKVAAGQSTSAGMFYDMQNTRVGFAKTEHYFNGSSLVLSNGPAGFWGDASGYV